MATKWAYSYVTGSQSRGKLSDDSATPVVGAAINIQPLTTNVGDTLGVACGLSTRDEPSICWNPALAKLLYGFDFRYDCFPGDQDKLKIPGDPKCCNPPVYVPTGSCTVICKPQCQGNHAKWCCPSLCTTSGPSMCSYGTFVHPTTGAIIANQSPFGVPLWNAGTQTFSGQNLNTGEFRMTGDTKPTCYSNWRPYMAARPTVAGKPAGWAVFFSQGPDTSSPWFTQIDQDGKLIHDFRFCYYPKLGSCGHTDLCCGPSPPNTCGDPANGESGDPVGAFASDGTLFIAWKHRAPANADRGIKYRLFDIDGLPLDSLTNPKLSEIKMASQPNTRCEQPRVAYGGGYFWVVWHEFTAAWNQGGTPFNGCTALLCPSCNIRATCFKYDSTTNPPSVTAHSPVGFIVNTGSTGPTWQEQKGQNPYVWVDNTGRAYFTWEDRRNGSPQVWASTHFPDGTNEIPEFLAIDGRTFAPHPRDYMQRPCVATTPNGATVVYYALEWRYDRGSYDWMARRFTR